MIIYLSLLVCIGGALVYALSKNPEVKEMGRLAYGCGLLAFLLSDAAAVLSVIRH